MSQALTFNDVQLVPVVHNNQPWIRSSELARALAYSDERKVSHLYSRHADEFSNDMTVVLNLGTREMPNETRIFSLRGCHLLAMFARTPVAKAFRVWVLDVLETLNKAEVRQAPQLDTTLRLSKRTDPERKELTAMVNAWVNSSPIGYAAARTIINAHFDVKSVDELTVEQVKEAVQFVQGKIGEAQKASSNPVESNVRLSPEAAKGLAARYPHLTDVFMKHAGQNLPVPVSTSYVNEIKALRDEADQRVCDFRIWLREFCTRLERATGPMVKELVCSQLLRGNRDSRGSTIVNSDYLISALHVFRWSDRKTLDDGLETMRYAMRDYESFARTLDNLRATSF